MPDNNENEGQLVNIVDSFHTTMNEGFKGVYKRMEKQDEKREAFDKDVTKRVTFLEDERRHLKVPVQPCPEMIALQEEKAEEKKAEAALIQTGKTEIIKFFIKAAGIGLLILLGLERLLA